MRRSLLAALVLPVTAAAQTPTVPAAPIHAAPPAGFFAGSPIRARFRGCAEGAIGLNGPDIVYGTLYCVSGRLWIGRSTLEDDLATYLAFNVHDRADTPVFTVPGDAQTVDGWIVNPTCPAGCAGSLYLSTQMYGAPGADVVYGEPVATWDFARAFAPSTITIRLESYDPSDPVVPSFTALVADTAIIPEPSTVALAGVGVALLGLWARRRSARA